MASVETRRANRSDIEAIGRIQAECETASQWNPADYLGYQCRVAECGGEAAGFLVWRGFADECEILNLAVATGFRRRGVARRLLEELLATRPAAIFLEVRESNHGAQAFYRKLGFSEAGKRPGYYQFPTESAVVMKWQSC